MDNVVFAVLFIVKYRSTFPNYNSFSNPSISLPSLRGRGRGWGFLGVGLFGGGAFGGLALWGICAFHLEHKRSDEVVADDTGEIAHESDPCDLLHVPSEGDLLQTHNHYSGCATYDEH